MADVLNYETNVEETIEIGPAEYFERVKAAKQTITDEMLLAVYDNCLELLNKYKITGQTQGIRKLIFHLECIEKEREIIKMGINTFVYRDDIEEYIDNIAKDVVKIIELEHYEREIPDEIVDVVSKVKDKFDKLYVVFTDYTGKVERKVNKVNRERDPILFGTFQDTSKRVVIDRFYYLGDWVDDYCDLTLDKFVNETTKAGKRDVVKTISTPKDIAELKAQLDALDEKNDTFILKAVPKSKANVFHKVKTFLQGEKQ